MEYVPKRFNKELFSNAFNSNDLPILIAVLDTGVSVGAYGLTKCPDGSNKVVDVIDCSGSDTVNTSTIKTLDSLPQKIKELVGTDITNPVEIFYGTRSLRTFVSDRSFKAFEENQKKVIADLILCVYTYKFVDAFVTIVDSDDEVWKLGEYHIKQEYGSICLNDGLFLTFAVHVYDEGKSTSLVFDTGSHSTHVSGIIAGYFPDKPEQNGINPNAKILSLKIGDSRVDGMETSLALCRALEEMVKHECKLANYSFGESVCPTDPKSLSLTGRFIDMLEEYAQKHGIIFVTSAGNSGPQMGTVGAPRMCTESVISVGAYTDSTLLNGMYFLAENGFENGPYDWSSRGPMFNRSMGVDLLATGCALTSHPQWFRSNMNMCNGTSMAAPNSVGIISLVLQNHKNNGVDLPFYWVKKYMESNCKKLENLEGFSQGHGLLFGQIHGSDQFNKPLQKIRNDDYSYEVVSGNTKEHVGEFIKINLELKEKNAGIVVQNIFIKISPKKIKDSCDLVSFRKVLNIKSSLDKLDFCEISYPSSVIVDSRGRTVRIQLRIDLNKMGDRTISEFIEFYEEDDDNCFVAYYPVNIVGYTEIESSVAKLPFNVKAGHINRYYFKPLKNRMTITINSDDYAHNHLCVDVAKLSDIDAYNGGSRVENYMIEKSKMSTPIEFNCVPNTVYELVVYLSWSTGTNGKDETVLLDLNCFNVNVNLDKTCAKTGDVIFAEFYCENDEENEKTTELTKSFKICNVVSQYYPYAETTNNNVLEMKYKLNKHSGKCKYFVDTCNKVYNSDVTMSACIYGYRYGKLFFMGNYVPKTSEYVIDEIIIKISDKDSKRLQQYSGLILNVQRDVKDIDVATHYDNNVVQLSLTKDMLKKVETYYDDVFSCKFLNQNVTFINKCKTVEQSKDTNINTQLVDFCKSFNMLTLRDEIVKMDQIIKSSKDVVTFANLPLLHMVNSLISDNTFVNTILPASVPLKKGQSTEAVIPAITAVLAPIVNEKQKFYDLIKLNKLEDKAPFCAYRYLWKIMNPTDVAVDLDGTLESLDAIEKNMDYWSDLNIFDLAQKRFKLISDLDTENKHIKKKRRYQYMIESEYGY